MDIKIRRIIVIGFFLFFFITAPILIMYATGFRYDFKTGNLLKTGNIFIEIGQVRGAQIFLDNKEYQETIDRKIYIKNTLPGEYNLRISKDGYFSWEKKIRVEPSLTTFVQNITLFAANAPELIYSGEVSNTLPSPDGTLLAFIANKDGFQEIQVYDLNLKNFQLLDRIATAMPIQMTWGASSNKIMSRIGDEITIYRSRTPYTFSNLTVKNNTWVDFDQNDDNYLYKINNKTVSQVNSINFKEITLYAAKDKNYLLPTVNGSKKTVYFIENTPANSILRVINKEFKINLNLSELPKNEQYKIDDLTDKYVAISSHPENKTYLIKKGILSNLIEVFQESKIELPGSNPSFSPDGEYLLIHDDFAINVLDLKSNDDNLVNRFGQILKDVSWYSDSRHLVINFDDKVLISDIQTVSQTSQISEILNNAQITDQSSVNENNLAISGQVGDNKGLFLIKIR